MRIVYVYPQFAHFAGTERVLIDKMNYLANQKDFEIIMLTYEQGSHPLAYPLSSKVKHVDLDVRFYPLYKYNRIVRTYKWHLYTKILRERFNVFMANVKPDIVITTTYYSNIISMIDACQVEFVKILESHIDRRYIHNNDPHNIEKWTTWLRSLWDMRVLNQKSRKFDIVVTLNEQDAHEWSRILKTKIIPNIVHLNDTGRYSSLDSKHVIFVGRYTHQKGIIDLFKIWKLVFARNPDWHLDLYGDGDMRLIPYSDSECLHMNIHVHKPVCNIFDKYLDSSIFVLTSLYEPFGLVMPEAMSCGLPVVAFNCPSGPANIITDGVDGFLILERDINSFANKLCQLIESIDLRKEMSQAAILSSQNYSANKIMGQWVDLFNELVPTVK